MKIVQLVTNLNEGDAIGSDMLAIHRTLTVAGYDCRIMAQTIHPHFVSQAQHVRFSEIRPEDLLIFHKATGDQFVHALSGLKCRKGIVYHNITPAKYCLPYDGVMAWNLWRGRRQVRRLAECMDFAWGDSSYNCQELIRAGFPKEKVFLLPILFEEHIQENEADEALKQKLNARAGTKLLFIGRIAPNKKQEDIIKVFYHYLREEDPQAVLYLVGSWEGMDKYYAKLKGFAADLGLTENQVVFTGHISEAEKAAYLQCADVLVCMSEHEGFCVPLLEAMRRDVPIAAYASTAIPETLGDNGMLFEQKDYAKIANQIGRLRRDAAFRREVISKQRRSLERFDEGRVRDTLLKLVRQTLTEGEQRE